MESIKEKMPMIIAIILAITIIIVAVYFIENYEAEYYTKIDNSKIQKISSTDDMKYQYKLDCYNKNGHKKAITFKTSRELREDAYLMLEVRIIGVHSWKEIQYNELPDKVKENYK